MTTQVKIDVEYKDSQEIQLKKNINTGACRRMKVNESQTFRGWDFFIFLGKSFGG